ncbi:hypothetical protein ACTS9T_08775 [Empedobacter falsenii]|uniref:hypothetical protein n=1 Tax=uncultured Empedobacter sp. TaxID=410844 RepID=UPI0025D6A44C|nr:hypothetical protein [uncultured Empedobacter sp.]
MIRNIIAIISTIGIIIWIITDFYGGMFIYLLSYPFLVLPIILLYVFSFFETLALLIRSGFKKNIIKVVFHSVLILIIIIFNLTDSEIFKSKKILSATLKDDQYYYNLVFRENGEVENNINGMFGYSERIAGKYKINGDTIIFTKVPYDNDFIPDTLLIDKEQSALFMFKDESGKFIREKQFLNHLEINNCL